jgi:RNA polymerase sigma-70 factor (ECF subfamily)
MVLSRKKKKLFEKEALPHLDALYCMAMRLARNERDAEDLVQDCMIKAFRFFHQYEEGTNIKAWLFKILINLFYNNCRKNKTIQRLHLEVARDDHHERFLSEATAAGHHFEQVLMDKVALEAVRKAIDELPEEFRVAILLCEFHGLSYKEISDVLGCPVGTVMSRLYRGRRLLQKKLYNYALEQGYIRPAEEEEAPAPAGDAAEGRLADLSSYRLKRGRS